MNDITRKRYSNWIATAQIRDKDRSKVAAALARAKNNRARFERAADLHGVPWTLLAALQEREASGRMDRHIANGDPLTDRTKHVPAGLPANLEPPYQWEDVLDEELADLEIPSSGNWTLEDMCYAAERFNGWGYAKNGRRSPYIVASTTLQTRGKYTSDHTFDESHWDEQIGVLALWIAMRDDGIPIP